jgi:hypothetical protein
VGILQVVKSSLKVFDELRRTQITVYVNEDWSGRNLSKSNFVRAVFINIKLNDADLSEANLREADLRLSKLLQTNLNQAKLVGADLSGADLSNADLTKANLFGANLKFADLSGAKLQGADLSEANLNHTKLIGANLSGANLRGASLIHTNLNSAILKGAKIYGVSSWNLELEGTDQSNLVITQPNEPAVMVDNVEVAQFIYLLLNREKLRDVLNTMTKRGVLILGRFKDGGLDVLQAIAGKIRDRGYLPMLFDFEASTERDFTETVKIMVGLSRFVIVDLSGPSVPKELEATVPDFEVPFIPVFEQSRGFPSMIVDLAKYPWFRWPPFEFADRENLVERLQEAVIDPAEEMGKAREERRALLFSAQDK